MARRSDLKPRKQPRQERSRQMQADILEAAVRVLEEDGVAGFNTNRVAERAGISVGSLYQYFPNKTALLFRLHELETSDTGAGVAKLLADEAMPARERVRRAVRFFFETEELEVSLREALACAQIYFRETPEFAEVERDIVATIADFLRAVRPPSRAAGATHDAAFTVAVLAGTSEYVTSRGLRGRALRALADRSAEMLCDHLGIDA